MTSPWKSGNDVGVSSSHDVESRLRRVTLRGESASVRLDMARGTWVPEGVWRMVEPSDSDEHTERG